MRIKRFVAPDMRTALKMVRDEHGPDAVILSNRRTEEGVEIVAANNYDENVVQRALDTANPTAAAAKPKKTTRSETVAISAPVAQAPIQTLASQLTVSALTANSTTSQAVTPSSAINSSETTIAAVSESISNKEISTNFMNPESLILAMSQAKNAVVNAVKTDKSKNKTKTTKAASNTDSEITAKASGGKVNAETSAESETSRRTEAQRSTGNNGVSETINASQTAQEQAARDIDSSPLLGNTENGISFNERLNAVLENNSLNQLLQPKNPIPEVTATQLADYEVENLEELEELFEKHPEMLTAPRPPKRSNDDQLADLRDELSSMRKVIEREMNRMTDERLRGSPVRSHVIDLMESYGFDAEIMRNVALQIPNDTAIPRGRGLMLGLLAKELPVSPIDPLVEGGIIALIGPTGAGKTTTIAKLAARYAKRHHPRDIALVTTDTVRMGGREQLYGYGRQLGITVHEANSDNALYQLLDRLNDYKLVLIDTAGLGQRDRSLAAQLHWLRGAKQVRSLLVMPANSQFSDLDEVVRRFSPAKPQGVVMTKIDETGRLGSALSVIVNHQLPVAWVTDGQRVPDDLHRANAANLVLRLEDLRRAAETLALEPDHATA